MSQPAPASRQLMRAINVANVLNRIRQDGPVSRVALARATQLSAATVTGITTTLIERGLVSEREPGVSTGGRRPMLLRFEHQAGVAVGVKVTERELILAVTDLHGRLEESTRIPLPAGSTPERVVELIAEAVSQIADGVRPRFVAGIGVGIAGVVDRPSGVSRVSPFLHWADVPLQAMLSDATGHRVLVDNDVSTLAWAFRSDLADLGLNTYLVVSVGRGIGLGVMLPAGPFRGGRGQGGEFGHIVVQRGGPLCECGNRGCLEAVAGLPAIRDAASQRVGRPVDDRDLRQLVEAADPLLFDLLATTADMLGRSLAMLVNLFNPGAIVFSGEGAWLVSRLIPDIETAMREDVFDGLAVEMQMRVEERGDEFWAAGAAGALLETLFQPGGDGLLEGVA